MYKAINFSTTAAIASLFIFCLGLTACDAPPPPEKAEVLRPIRYTIVQPGLGGAERRFAGVAKPGLDTRLSFRVSGPIQALPVKAGDSVRKGQLIARLDAEDLSLQVQQSESALLRAEAEARNADASYARIRALYENQSASRNELDSARAAWETTNALTDSSRKQLQLARQQLSYTELNVPFTGCSVAKLFVESNENVSAGQPIVELGCGELMEVHVPVPETYITHVQPGQTVEVRFSAMDGTTYAAKVTEVGVSATGGTTFPVTAKLTKDIKGLRAGMAAEVAFAGSDEGTARIWLPTVAVIEDREGRFVFIAIPSDETTATIERRTVTIGAISPRGLEITDGLTEGERVVIAGVSKIRPGQQVRLLAAERR